MSAMPASYPHIWSKLSAANQVHAQKYMEFLYQQQENQPQMEEAQKAEAKLFGILKGKMIIPEGFDDPMPEFKEYM